MTTNGVVEGTSETDSGIRSFKGIPFAAPPVGELRWKPPQLVISWEGVRNANQFGPRAMQLPLFGDMSFRSTGMSEDCLSLNVWTPATSDEARLPVLVYFYGGGNVAGDGSELRYDGARLARKGIVAVTVNYRLNVFGFFAHPELTAESPQHASGNYGYLDQTAALHWVRQNIAAFGGDPARITIAGESAGSISVSLQMVSPLAKDLIAGAIGSSGSVMGTLPAIPLAQAEHNGIDFASSVGATSLAALRALSAARLLEATSRLGPQDFTAVVDGYFLPKLPMEIFAAGEQAHVPLLMGWNSEEMSYQGVMGMTQPTPENVARVLQMLYGDLAGEAQRLYPAATAEEAMQSATDLGGDRFIGYSTWKWCDLHSQTGAALVYPWHGNSAKALDRLRDVADVLEWWDCDEDGEKQVEPGSEAAARMLKYVRELDTYIANNAPSIVNYGERYHNGERISTGITEGRVNRLKMIKRTVYGRASFGLIRQRVLAQV